jgi:DNA processing protein
LARKHEPQHPTPADAIDRLRLARTEGVGPVGYRRLLARYGSAAAALGMLPGLARAGGRPSPPACPSPDDAMRELYALDRLGASMIFAGEAGYPPLLAMLDDAPAVLTVLGNHTLWRTGQLRWWADATPRPMASAWRRTLPRNWRTPS